MIKKDVKALRDLKKSLQKQVNDAKKENKMVLALEGDCKKLKEELKALRK